MRKPQSFWALWLILAVLLVFRLQHQPLKVTTWDALGYYTYLPGTFIYHELTTLDWCNAIDQQYQVTGNGQLSVVNMPNGHRPLKYFCGVALMELPWFAMAHLLAKPLGYPADGFSAPYQYLLAFGMLLYAWLGLWALRKFLLYYFDDGVTALTLLLVALATNYLQYAGADVAQSHAFIFPLYALILLATKKWHEQPSKMGAATIGFILGLATVCRPTEAVMLFIPLLWNTHTKAAAQEKWKLVRQNKNQFFIVFLAAFLMVLPQLIYWKIVTGTYLFDVGSSWRFLTPHWQVLFGFNKGWFIYTPVTVFFVLGFLFIKKYPFRKSVLWFCLLNMWIVLAWSDWRYGGSYSTRALMQSYPVFALPLAALLSKILYSRWQYVVLVVATYLIGVNLFQTHQYNDTVLHYYDMNRKYYGAIYLNPYPTPLDFSLLDVPDKLKHPEQFQQSLLTQKSIPFVKTHPSTLATLWDTTLTSSADENWLRVTARLVAQGHYWANYWIVHLEHEKYSTLDSVRLYRPLINEQGANDYDFYLKLPALTSPQKLSIGIGGREDFEGDVQQFKVTLYTK